MTRYSLRCFQSQRSRKCSLAVFLAASALLAFGCASTSSSFPPGCLPIGDTCIDPIRLNMPPLIDHAVLRLAVLPLSENGVPAEIKSTAGQTAISMKKSFPRLEIVERSRIDIAMRELEFQASGRVRDDNFVGVGRMLGADHVFVYEITSALDRDLQAVQRTGGSALASCSGKLIHVQTGTVVFQEAFELGAILPPPLPGKHYTYSNIGERLKLDAMRWAIQTLFAQLVEALVPSPIGAMLSAIQDSNRVTVFAVMFVGPAYNAGLRQGDIITAVDGIPVHGVGDPVLRDLDMIPRELVHMTIEREGREQTLAVRPVRRNRTEKSFRPLTEQEELEFRRRLEKERASSPPAKP
jgi:PDZ domain